MIPTPGTIWIQGAGELASGVAWRLCRSGYQIVLAEIPAPRAVRRLVCFSEAVYASVSKVEGLTGTLVTADEVKFEKNRISIVVDPDAQQLRRLCPAAVVDARLTKKTPIPLPQGPHRLIGLGPGFECGRDADLVIETHRGARMGEVLDVGQATANTGIPGEVGGETALRLLRAPAAGRLVPTVSIGDMVEKDQIVGHMGNQAVLAQLSGRVRGLVHPNAELSVGEKVGDVDPRGLSVDPARITDKSLAVAGGVLEALLRLGILP